MTKTDTITIRIEREEKDKLRQVLNKEQKSISQFLLEVIKRKIKKHT